MSLVDVSATTHPVADYNEATNRIKAIQSRDTADTLSVARTQFMAQGRKVTRAIVFLHSLSNSPEQFYELGKRFFDEGYNVLIPRMPYHGSANRMTTEQAQLDGNRLLSYLNEAVDVAQGLGDFVVVAGQSLGGVLAAMCALYRRDVDLTVLISPTFGLWGLPHNLSYRLARTMLGMPNRFIWWNLLQGERFGPDYIYPRVSSHALAHGLELAHQAMTAAGQMKGASRGMILVTHPRDPFSTPSAAGQFAKLIEQKGLLVREEKIAALPARHDIVDPWSIGAHRELVHDMLVDLITPYRPAQPESPDSPTS